jgi:acyl carrier protein
MIDQGILLIKITEALDCEENLKGEEFLVDIEGWDSLGLLSIIQVFSDLGCKPDPEKIKKCARVSDLLKLAVENNEI